MCFKKIVDSFAVLGVSPDTPQCEVRRAYINLVKKLHPDKCTYLHANPEFDNNTQIKESKEDIAAFVKVQNAYETICAHMNDETPVPFLSATQFSDLKTNFIKREDLKEVTIEEEIILCAECRCGEYIPILDDIETPQNNSSVFQMCCECCSQVYTVQIF